MSIQDFVFIPTGLELLPAVNRGLGIGSRFQVSLAEGRFHYKYTWMPKKKTKKKEKEEEEWREGNKPFVWTITRKAEHVSSPSGWSDVEHSSGGGWSDGGRGGGGRSKNGGGGGGIGRRCEAADAELHSGESKSHSQPQSQSHSKAAMLTINNPVPNESSFNSVSSRQRMITTAWWNDFFFFLFFFSALLAEMDWFRWFLDASGNQDFRYNT